MLDICQRIVSTIHITGLVKKILVISKHIAATATNDIDMVICIAPSRACILKPSIRIAGRRRNILNEKYRITYRIVQGVNLSHPISCHLKLKLFQTSPLDYIGKYDSMMVTLSSSINPLQQVTIYHPYSTASKCELYRVQRNRPGYNASPIWSLKAHMPKPRS